MGRGGALKRLGRSIASIPTLPVFPWLVGGQYRGTRRRPTRPENRNDYVANFDGFGAIFQNRNRYRHVGVIEDRLIRKVEPHSPF
jgi:hypothetical protein